MNALTLRLRVSVDGLNNAEALYFSTEGYSCRYQVPGLLQFFSNSFSQELPEW
jgi:hypothetical protein